ncbi:hypothetical protein NCCP1664_12360 [Zafaria cholistanensis]|uniref:Uncharacterized protein n=1 Tax=Zafaria cholistanensis TaxID=1682741 RepID=A0A5A7NPW7_9MICC|nr:hypothetical protein [Zafaria cholistanensis]GER22739.1 hypothetical protein NCCP1664_12360 [Zafaria cholistanensis]
MAKNNQRTGAKGPSGTAPRSLGAMRADRELAGLTTLFIEWYDDGSEPGLAEEARVALKVFTAALGGYFDSDPAASATAYRAELLAVVLDRLITSTSDDDVVDHAVRSARIFTLFLEDTGRWTGTEEELEELYRLFDEVESMASDLPEIPEEHIPDIEPAAQLEVLAKLPLVAAAGSILRWLGDGKDLDEELMPTALDEEAAAAALAADGAAALPVDQLLAVLEVSGLVSIDAETRRAVPTGEAAEFGTEAASDESRRAAYAALAVAYYWIAVTAFSPDLPLLQDSSELLAVVLVAAASPTPPTVEDLLASSDGVGESADDVVAVTHGRLLELAQAGLVDLAEADGASGPITLAPALVPLLAEALDRAAEEG